jgi:hypothetical protein
MLNAPHGLKLKAACLCLLVASCGGRSASVSDAAVGTDSTTRLDAAGLSKSDGPVSDTGASPAAFCSGKPKASVNMVELSIKSVEVLTYVSAASKEGAMVSLVGVASDGEQWKLDLWLQVGLGHTLTGLPLPHTISLASPPPGLDVSVHFSYPAECQWPKCATDLLGLEYHEFEGTFTISGKSYDGPNQLEICLSARDTGKKQKLVQLARIYHPALTIPRWDHGWPGP